MNRNSSNRAVQVTNLSLHRLLLLFVRDRTLFFLILFSKKQRYRWICSLGASTIHLIKFNLKLSYCALGLKFGHGGENDCSTYLRMASSQNTLNHHWALCLDSGYKQTLSHFLKLYFLPVGRNFMCSKVGVFEILLNISWDSSKEVYLYRWAPLGNALSSCNWCPYSLSRMLLCALFQ